MSNVILAPISVGELVDKITILQIKEKHAQGEKLTNIKKELDELRELMTINHSELRILSKELEDVNQIIWDVEDEIRICEKNQDFGPRFVELARQVYINNDLRAVIKRKINVACDSHIIEEKIY